MEVDKLIIELPGKDEKGFLRRTRKALQLKEMLERTGIDNVDSSIIDDLLDFILIYVKQPSDKVAAREMLLDASEEQFHSIVSALSSGETNPTSPQPNESDSRTGSEESENQLAGD